MPKQRVETSSMKKARQLFRMEVSSMVCDLKKQILSTVILLFECNRYAIQAFAEEITSLITVLRKLGHVVTIMVMTSPLMRVKRLAAAHRSPLLLQHPY